MKTEDELMLLIKKCYVYAFPRQATAMELWGLLHAPTPSHPAVPLIAVHKARIVEYEAAIKESKEWLKKRGLSTTIAPDAIEKAMALRFKEAKH